jgi:Transglutaminase-like superfamily
VRRSRARLRALSGWQRIVLLRALVRLPVTWFALRVRGLGPVRAEAGRAAPVRVPGSPSPPGSLETARQIADVVGLAARHGVVRTNCLPTSVVLWRLLRRRGIDADLRFGARRRPEDPTPEFHAWVEYDGVVLNDRPDVAQRYAIFDRRRASAETLSPPGPRPS